jgi:hypothetical protein
LDLVRVATAGTLTSTEYSGLSEALYTAPTLFSSFSPCTATPENRAKIVASSLALLDAHDFDGIDVDWECDGGHFKQRFSLVISSSSSAMLGEVDLRRRALFIS